MDGAQFFEFPAIKLAADLNQDITNTNIDADDDAMMLMNGLGRGNELEECHNGKRK